MPRQFLQAALLAVLASCAAACSQEYANRRYVLNAQVVDEENNPLSDITINTQTSIEHFGRFAYDKKQFISPDGHFTIDTSANYVDVRLSKEGYHPVAADLRKDSLGRWPRKPDVPTPIRLTLFADDDAPRGRRNSFTLEHTGEPGDPVINLKTLASDPDTDRAMVRLTANTYPLFPMIYGTPQRDDSGHWFLTLHIAGGEEGGFIHYNPQPFDDPLGQMRQAPADGYAAAYVLNAQRLAEMSASRGWPQGAEFLYFRLNNQYGRLRITSEDPHRLKGGHLNAPIALSYDITLLPLGTRRFRP